jgi:hypothetical protein
VTTPELGAELPHRVRVPWGRQTSDGFRLPTKAVNASVRGKVDRPSRRRHRTTRVLRRACCGVPLPSPARPAGQKAGPLRLPSRPRGRLPSGGRAKCRAQPGSKHAEACLGRLDRADSCQPIGVSPGQLVHIENATRSYYKENHVARRTATPAPDSFAPD